MHDQADTTVPVLVVDDHDAFRAALCELVEAAEGFTLVGQAASGQAALEAAGELMPRLVIMDKRLPGMDGIEATRRLVARQPDTVVVLVSMETPDEKLLASCGAAAFLRKQQLSPRRLREVWAEHGG